MLRLAEEETTRLKKQLEAQGKQVTQQGEQLKTKEREVTQLCESQGKLRKEHEHLQLSEAGPQQVAMLRQRERQAEEETAQVKKQLQVRGAGVSLCRRRGSAEQRVVRRRSRAAKRSWKPYIPR